MRTIPSLYEIKIDKLQPEQTPADFFNEGDSMALLLNLMYKGVVCSRLTFCVSVKFMVSL